MFDKMPKQPASTMPSTCSTEYLNREAVDLDTAGNAFAAPRRLRQAGVDYTTAPMLVIMLEDPSCDNDPGCDNREDLRPEGRAQSLLLYDDYRAGKKGVALCAYSSRRIATLATLRKMRCADLTPLMLLKRSAHWQKKTRNDELQVDFLLLGGNLFHENKPSNSTLMKTIEILRRYCMNDRPVQFQVISDQAASLQSRFGQVNYEDRNYNIGLPVFTIHGNHDGPSGVDNVSSNDILSAGNLLNYFGKTDLGCTGVGKVTVYPVFIRKGETYVSLYGLGNIRDERLNRMLHEPHAVNWVQPETGDGTPAYDDWFNIFVIHQNRTKGSPGNGISELLLPRFLDLVIWGHEHECLIDPQEAPRMGFHVTQPGSTIATSLINAEAKPKHVLLLEIKGTQYRPTTIPLQSVRPSEYAEVVLEDQVDIDPSDESTIHAHLHQIVSNLIEKARESAATGSLPKLPLVRIKVDYSGFSTINSKQFGQNYVGKVANPQDILVFKKSGKRCKITEGSTNSSGEADINELNQQTIEALIAENNLKMDILSVHDLNSALHDFVNEDETKAFHSCLRHSIDEARNKLNTATEDSRNIDEQQTACVLDQNMQAPEKEAIIKGRTGFQYLQTDTLSVSEKPPTLESDDEVVESSDLEENGSSSSRHQAGRKRRAAPGGAGDGVSAAAAAAGKRKTDLASFQRKEDDADAAKKHRAPVAGRYGAVIRRR